jgi:hypothetical protein
VTCFPGEYTLAILFILKASFVVGKMRKQIYKCPVSMWRSFARIFSDEAANDREEEKINEIVRKMIENGLLMGDKKFIPHGPVLRSKLPIK